MKLLFFGTPSEAAAFLAVCAEHEILAVVTRPDRPAGRGLGLRAPPVKELAGQMGLKVFQPEQPSLIAGELKAFGADAAVVVAYGRLLKSDVLTATRLGCLNVHFSSLPKFRGAAPIVWSLIRGERRTGVTVFWLDEGMDTGPVQSRRETDIGPDEDAVSLKARLIDLGMEALEEALLEIERGDIRREPQTGEPSLAPRLKREDGLISFDRPAAELHNLVRGLSGGLNSFFQLRDRREVLVLKTALDSPDVPAQAPPGTFLRVERGKGILIQCSSGRLWILEVRPQGKKQMPAADFLNGLRLRPGDRLPA